MRLSSANARTFTRVACVDVVARFVDFHPPELQTGDNQAPSIGSSRTAEHRNSALMRCASFDLNSAETQTPLRRAAHDNQADEPSGNGAPKTDSPALY